MKVLLGTRNRGKIQEFKQILSVIPAMEWLTFEDVPFVDVIEDGSTFEENALKKARQIFQQTQLPVLAEDAGLVVDALDGEPGVFSARYSGEEATSQQNISKLLSMLEGVEDRVARFVCCAVFIDSDGNEFVSHGNLEGRIAHEPRGHGGFGYDPVFILDEYAQTLAELDEKIKNAISHRRMAIEGLKDRLVQFAASSSAKADPNGSGSELL